MMNKLLFITYALFYCAIGHSQIITTLAGGGNGDGGAATSAPIINPSASIIDIFGNIYIADTYNNQIRKVDASTGIISTIAGNGIAGFGGDGATATAANLNSPSGLALDASGNLYIGDRNNNRIRKVDASTGIISTIAGNDTLGFGGDGGAATDANLYNPSGVAIDSRGNLYIADQYNNRIRKVAASTGIISTIAGNGTIGFGGDGGKATSAGLYMPNDLAIDSFGNLYVADQMNNRIRKVAIGSGIISTIAGNGIAGFGGDGNSASLANLNNPISIDIDQQGNLFIADQKNNRIRKVALGTGIITTIAGNGIYGFGGEGDSASSSILFLPSWVRIDQNANIYIVDQKNNRIRKIAAGTSIINTIAGNGSGAGGDGGAAISANLYNPTSLAIDEKGNLYIDDQKNNRIRKVEASSGIISTIAGNGLQGFGGDGGPAAAAGLNYPTGIALDSLGNLFIADFNNNRIRKVAVGTGIISTVAGNGIGGFAGDGGIATSANLKYVAGVAVDVKGNIYFSDQYNKRIRKVLANTGKINTIAGDGTAGSYGDGGYANNASLTYPTGLAIDGIGNLYIADQIANRIRKIDIKTNIISTIAGNGANGFSGDGGLATKANLSYPNSLVIDKIGNLYIADAGNSRIRKVAAATGIITTIAGNGIAGFGGDGSTATSANLNGPSGLALDASGNLYIGDANNNRIRKVWLGLDNNNISGNQTICSGSNADSLIGSMPAGGIGIYTYTWLKSTLGATSGFIPISSSNSIHYKPTTLTQNTWYKRYVVSDIYSDTSASVLITVNPIPSAVSLKGLVNVDVSLPYIYSIPSQANHTYLWSVTNGNIVSGQGTNAAQVQWLKSGTGKIKVQVTNMLNCSGADSIIVNIGNVSIAEINNFSQLELFPNPNNGDFKLKVTRNKASETRISLINPLGQEIWADNKTLSEGAQEIDLSTNLDAGVYILRLDNEDGQVMKSVVIK